MRAYFSRLLPRRVRDAHLDWCIRRLARTTFAHRAPPVTFNEKVRYKMLNDRRPLLTTFADKVAVREYVGAKVGKEILPELYVVTRDPKLVREDALPSEFALKPSHGSRACVIVGRHVAPEKELPEPPVGWVQLDVSPHSVDWGRLRRLCREWLYRRYMPRVEWAYRNVPPRILVEELLLEGGKVPSDYKFFVFHGRVRLVQVEIDRFGDHTRNFYSPEWDVVPVEKDSPRGPEVKRPVALAEMISIAEALGVDTDLVRVDLYDVGGRIVFGELTNYPGGGFNDFKPASFDHDLGAWWSLPNDYRSTHGLRGNSS